MKNFEWSVPEPPTLNKSYYDHTTLETPLGKFIIEWKSWKQDPSYSVELDSEWVGVEDSLEEAKTLAVQFLETKYNDLKLFLGEK